MGPFSTVSTDASALTERGLDAADSIVLAVGRSESSPYSETWTILRPDSSHYGGRVVVILHEGEDSAAGRETML